MTFPSQTSYTTEEKVKYSLIILTQKQILIYFIIEDTLNENGFNQKDKINNSLEGYYIKQTEYFLNFNDFIPTTIQITSENRILIGSDNNYIFELEYGIEVSKFFGIKKIVRKKDIYKESFLYKLIPSFFGFRKTFVCKKILIDDSRHLVYFLLHHVNKFDDILDINNAINSKILVYDLGNNGKEELTYVTEIYQENYDYYLKDFYKNNYEYSNLINNYSNNIFVDILLVPKNESNYVSLIIITKLGFRVFVEFIYKEISILADLEKWYILDRKYFYSYFKPSVLFSYENYSSEKKLHLCPNKKHIVLSVREPLNGISDIKSIGFLNSIINKSHNTKIMEDKKETSIPKYFYYNRKLYIFLNNLKETKLMILEPSCKYKNESYLISFVEKFNTKNISNTQNAINISKQLNDIYKNQFINKYRGKGKVKESIKDITFNDQFDVFEMYFLPRTSTIYEWKIKGNVINKFRAYYTEKNNFENYKKNFWLENMEYSDLNSSLYHVISTRMSDYNCLFGEYNTQYFFNYEEIQIITSNGISSLYVLRPIDILATIIQEDFIDKSNNKNYNDKESCNYNSTINKSKHENFDNNSMKGIFDFLGSHGLCETAYMLLSIFTTPDYTFFKADNLNSLNNQLISFPNSEKIIEVSFNIYTNLDNILFTPYFNSNKSGDSISNDLLGQNINETKFSRIVNDTYVPVTKVIDLNKSKEVKSYNYIIYSMFMFVNRLLNFFIEDFIIKGEIIKNEDEDEYSEEESYKSNIFEKNQSNNEILIKFTNSGNIKDSKSYIFKKKLKPKIKKTFVSMFTEREILSFIRIFSEFKVQLFKYKERILYEFLNNEWYKESLKQENNNFPYINFSQLSEEIDQVFYIVDTIIEALNLSSILSNSKYFLDAFVNTFSLEEQQILMKTTFKQLIFKKENKNIIKFLLDEYFQSLIVTSIDLQQFGNFVDIFFENCPSYLSVQDKQILYAMFIVNKSKLSILSKNNEIVNLLLPDSSVDQDVLEESESLKNAIDIICQNPLNVKLDVIVKILSSLSAIRHITRFCIARINFIGEILNHNTSKDKNINLEVPYKSVSLNQKGELKSFKFENEKIERISQQYDCLTIEDIEEMKTQVNTCITVIIKIIEEIDFRIENSNKYKQEEMNLMLINSQSFPKCLTSLFTQFKIVDNITINKEKDVNKNKKYSYRNTTKSDYLRMLSEWKYIIFEEIVKDQNPNILKPILIYLQKENKMKDILSLKSNYLENYLIANYQESQSFENLHNLYKYFSLAVKDANLSLNYLIDLIFYENPDIMLFNNNVPKLSLDFRISFCNEALSIIDSYSKNNSKDNKFYEKYFPFKSKINSLLESLKIQKDFSKYLLKLKEVNKSDDIQKFIEENLTELDYKVIDSTKLLEYCQYYNAFDIAIKIYQINYKNENTTINPDGILKIYTNYLDIIVSESHNNLQESLIFFLNQIFNTNYQNFNVNNLSELISNSDSAYLLSSIFPINFLVKSIEKINATNYPLEKHIYDNSKLDEKSKKKYFVNSLSDMLSFNYVKTCNSFWFASYLIDHLKIDYFYVINVYIAIINNANNEKGMKFLIPHFKLVVFFIIYRLTAEIEENINKYGGIPIKGKFSFSDTLIGSFYDKREILRNHFAVVSTEIAKDHCNSYYSLNKEEIVKFITFVENYFEKTVTIIEKKMNPTTNKFSNISNLAINDKKVSINDSKIKNSIAKDENVIKFGLNNFISKQLI